MTGTLFFDIGNVLLFFSHEKMCRQLAELSSLPYQKVYDYLFHKAQNFAIEYELGKMNSESFHRHFSRTFEIHVDFISWLKAIGDIFEPNKEIFPIIEALKANKHKLILLSNICEAHFNYAYSHFPILRSFDDKILSYEVKMRKPDPLIYRAALALAQDTPCFYVDDIPEYVQSARLTGLDAESYKTSGELKSELQKRKFLSEDVL
jgi:glucose-1-phosphatase